MISVTVQLFPLLYLDFKELNPQHYLLAFLLKNADVLCLSKIYMYLNLGCFFINNILVLLYIIFFYPRYLRLKKKQHWKHLKNMWKNLQKKLTVTLCYFSLQSTYMCYLDNIFYIVI